MIPTHQHDKEKIALSLLPAAEDDEVLRCNIIILNSRVLIENMDFFKFSFDGVGQWHIKHEFYNEMSSKSNVVNFRVYVRTCMNCYVISIPYTFYITTDPSRNSTTGRKQD